MRMWHYKLLPYLPDMQLKGQLRELVAILHNWRDNGTPRHGLVNSVMYFPKAHFYSDFKMYQAVYEQRFRKPLNPKVRANLIVLKCKDCVMDINISQERNIRYEKHSIN